MKIGKVYLVGAGPGDPGILTVRGLELLRAADVVVYDQLVGSAILAEAAGAIKIYVGKQAGKHYIDSGGSCCVLVEYGRPGHDGVRRQGRRARGCGVRGGG